jgi:hypothetical protein
MVDVVYRDEKVLVVFADDIYDATDLFLQTKKMEPYYAMEPNI